VQTCALPTYRDDQPVVPGDRLAQVVLLGGGAADQRLVSGDLARGVANAGDQVEGRGAVGVLGEGALELGAGRSALDSRRDLGDAGGSSHGGADGVDLRATGDR